MQSSGVALFTVLYTGTPLNRGLVVTKDESTLYVLEKIGSCNLFKINSTDGSLILKISENSQLSAISDSSMLAINPTGNCLYVIGTYPNDFYFAI